MNAVWKQQGNSETLTEKMPHVFVREKSKAKSWPTKRTYYGITASRHRPLDPGRRRWAACIKCSGERKRFRHILVYPAEVRAQPPEEKNEKNIYNLLVLRLEIKEPPKKLSKTKEFHARDEYRHWWICWWFVTENHRVGQGGRECAPADLEDVGPCPNLCAEDGQEIDASSYVLCFCCTSNIFKRLVWDTLKPTRSLLICGPASSIWILEEKYCTWQTWSLPQKRLSSMFFLVSTLGNPFGKKRKDEGPFRGEKLGSQHGRGRLGAPAPWVVALVESESELEGWRRRARDATQRKAKRGVLEDGSLDNLDGSFFFWSFCELE